MRDNESLRPVQNRRWSVELSYHGTHARGVPFRPRAWPSTALLKVERVQANCMARWRLQVWATAPIARCCWDLPGTNRRRSIRLTSRRPWLPFAKHSASVLPANERFHFSRRGDLLFHRSTMFPPGAHTQHPNGLRLTACDAAGSCIEERTFFSIGGGFIVEDGAAGLAGYRMQRSRIPFPVP